MESPEDAEKFQYTPENPWTPPKRPEGYDELGEEMAPKARVWKKYVEETDKADKELVEGWNKTLDVILIFAALFSAISTAFVLESSKDLKQDYTQTSAQTLLTLSQTLSAIANGSPAKGSTLEVPGPDSFSPSFAAVAVNVLWFLSLSLSVAVSLIAILAKDWCSHFMSGRVGPILRQGRLRQQRWNEIERWKMKEIMNVLPLLMHIALLLFAIGLSVYLWDINLHVALPVVVTTCLAALFYVVTVSLPLFFRYCPYTTALTRFISPHWLALIGHTHMKDGVGILAASVGWISYQMISLKRLIQDYIYRPINQPFFRPDLEASTRLPLKDLTFEFSKKKAEAHNAVEEWITSMRSVASTDRSQLDALATPMDHVTSTMLSWMITSCEDPKAINMALQALAGASKGLPRRPLWECGAVQLVCQRVETCFEQIIACFGMAESPNDTVIEETSLYSRSHGFLTAFTKEGELELLGTRVEDFRFKLNDGSQSITGIGDAASHAFLLFVCHSATILNCLWRNSRYDLSAYELNNIPIQIDSPAWESVEALRNQHLKQWELIENLISGRVSNLPTTAVIAMINGITKTYLYNPSQSPVLLLRLLHNVIVKNDPKRYFLQAVATGLTVASFSTGIFSMEWKQPDTESLLDVEQLQHWQAMQAYKNITARELEPDECNTLIFFGLVCLLGDLSKLDALSASDIRPIYQTLQGILSRPIYHSILPLPPSFGPGHHMAQVLSSLIRAVVRHAEEESDCKAECELSFCVRADTLLSSPMSHMFASTIIPVLIWDPMHVDSVRLSRMRFQNIKSIMLSVDHDHVQSDLLVFFNRVVEQVESTTDPHVLPSMEFLWAAGGELLGQETCFYPREPNRITINTLLPTLYNPSTSTPNGKPNNLHELGLANHLLPKIVDMCRDDPASVLAGKLLESMIKFYEHEDHKYIKPHIEEFPGSVNPTWLEILMDLERRCELAVERENEYSAVTSASIEDEPEGEHKQDATPDWPLYDGSI